MPVFAGIAPTRPTCRLGKSIASNRQEGSPYRRLVSHAPRLELFVFVARPDLWKRNNAWTLAEFERRGNMPERAHQYFKKIQKSLHAGPVRLGESGLVPTAGVEQADAREPIGWGDMKVWSQKSTALAAAHFMLAMRPMGLIPVPWREWIAVESRHCSICHQGLNQHGHFCRKKDIQRVYGERFRFPRDCTDIEFISVQFSSCQLIRGDFLEISETFIRSLGEGAS